VHVLGHEIIRAQSALRGWHGRVPPRFDVIIVVIGKDRKKIRTERAITSRR
jgi:hypothetical protein